MRIFCVEKRKGTTITKKNRSVIGGKACAYAMDSNKNSMKHLSINAATVAENNNANATIYRTAAAASTPPSTIARNKDASKVLEAHYLIQQMDGIISGKQNENRIK